MMETATPPAPPQPRAFAVTETATPFGPPLGVQPLEQHLLAAETALARRERRLAANQARLQRQAATLAQLVAGVRANTDRLRQVHDAARRALASPPALPPLHLVLRIRVRKTGAAQ